MATRYILSLDRRGVSFMSSVKQYMDLTNQPRRPETAKEIYTRCISEILFHMVVDSEKFIYNTLMMPSWIMINFTGERIHPPSVEEFAHEVRSFALFIHEKLKAVNPIGFDATYTMAYADVSVLVVDVHYHDVPV